MASQKGSGVETEGRNGDAESVAAADVTEATPDTNVEKIRDILFGGQMQDYELRFTALENRLASAAAELREETRARLDALEAYAKKQLGSLSDRLGAERRERAEAIGSAEADAAAMSSALELRIDALDERTAADDGELRDQLLQQSKALGDDLRRVQRALSEQIDEEARALRSSTTDRQALAAMMADVAMRLSDPEGTEPDAR